MCLFCLVCSHVSKGKRNEIWEDWWFAVSLQCSHWKKKPEGTELIVRILHGLASTPGSKNTVKIFSEEEDYLPLE